MSSHYDDDGFVLEENSVDDLEGFGDGIDRVDDDDVVDSHCGRHVGCDDEGDDSECGRGVSATTTTTTTTTVHDYVR